MPDFGGSTGQVQDAYVNYRYLPGCNCRRANSSRRSGWRQLQADLYTLFFNERSLVTDLVPNRDLGFELHGDLFAGGVVSYAAGIFNGVWDDSAQDEQHRFRTTQGFDGRIFLQPLENSQT